MATTNDPERIPASDDSQDSTDFALPPMLARPPESGFGLRVKAARTHHRLNVEALSRLTKAYDDLEGRGVSGAAISRYEAGEALPGAREFRLIAEALRLSADWLLFGVLSTGGKTDAQQRLFSALLEVIDERKDDANVGGMKQSEWLKFHDRAEWFRRIAEARKPVDRT